MAEVGAYEAKTHLSELLERVASGERITITKHGVPVAVLVPADPGAAVSASETVSEMRAFRKGKTRGDGSLKEMIEEGRR